MDDCGDASDEMAAACNKTAVIGCTFDSDSEHCDWSVERDAALNSNWYIEASDPKNIDHDSGPVTDHTNRCIDLGSFYTLKGVAADVGKHIRYVSPVVKTVSSGQACALRFFYYMYGQQLGGLQVYARFIDAGVSKDGDVLLKSATDNVGQKWNRAVVGVSDSRSFQFVINAQIGLSDIAIDEISYSDGCMHSSELPSTTTTTTTPSLNTQSSDNTNSGASVTENTVKTTKAAVIGNSSPSKPSNGNYHIKLKSKFFLFV
jgi:hypothetical protein